MSSRKRSAASAGLETPQDVFYKSRGAPRRPFLSGGDPRQYQNGGRSSPVTPTSADEDTAVRVLESSFEPSAGPRALLPEEACERVDGRTLFALQSLNIALLAEGATAAAAAVRLGELFSLSVSGVQKALARARNEALLTPEEVLELRSAKSGGRPLALSEDDCAAAVAAARKQPKNAAHAAYAELKKRGVEVS